eukprot:TRINITY_DN1480_c0_g1_i2.p1 TRINITY_DN1480_c0_g1~~TRINITY_DN1480_c0_g1_i2.p1  ORF type:complete len:2822 (+),score=1017.84 TRINITY_DN1480_c0_g1_i2:34-8499(+)
MSKSGSDKLSIFGLSGSTGRSRSNSSNRSRSGSGSTKKKRPKSGSGFSVASFRTDGSLGSPASVSSASSRTSTSSTSSKDVAMQTQAITLRVIKVFSTFINYILEDTDLKVNDFAEDLKDGIILGTAVGFLTGSMAKLKRENSLKRYIKNYKRTNDFLSTTYNLDMSDIDINDLVSGNTDALIEYTWRIIERFHIRAHIGPDLDDGWETSNAMVIAFRNRLLPYPNVFIKDLAQSWKDGIALCALIHSLDPSLIDLKKLDVDNPFENVQLAQNVALEAFSIPQIISPFEMVSFETTTENTRFMMIYLAFFLNDNENLQTTTHFTEETEPLWLSMRRNTCLRWVNSVLNTIDAEQSNIPPSYVSEVSIPSRFSLNNDNSVLNKSGKLVDSMVLGQYQEVDINFRFVRSLVDDLQNGVYLISILRHLTGDDSIPCSGDSLSAKATKKNIKTILNVLTERGALIHDSFLDDWTSNQYSEMVVMDLVWIVFNTFFDPMTDFNFNTNSISGSSNANKMTDELNSTLYALHKQTIISWINDLLKPLDESPSVDNLTTSLSNGLAFAAAVHSTIPIAVPLAVMDPDDAFFNLELAFAVAEKYLRIPRLIDPASFLQTSQLVDERSSLMYLCLLKRPDPSIVQEIADNQAEFQHSEWCASLQVQIDYVAQKAQFYENALQKEISLRKAISIEAQAIKYGQSARLRDQTASLHLDMAEVSSSMGVGTSDLDSENGEHEPVGYVDAEVQTVDDTSMVCWICNRHASKESVDVILRALNEPNRNRVFMAARAITTLGGAASTALPRLLDLLKSETDQRMCTQLIKAIAAIGGEATGELIGIANDEMLSPQVRTNAIKTIQRLGESLPESTKAAIRPLMQLLASSPSSIIRQCAMDAIRVIAPRDPRVLEASIVALQDSDDEVRNSAATHIGNLGIPEGIPAIEPLVDALVYESSRFHGGKSSAIATTLAKLGLDALPALSAGLESSNVSIRAHCASALGLMREKAAIALPLLVRRLADPSYNVRLFSVIAISQIDETTSFDDSTGTLRDGARSLNALALVQLLNHSNVHVRRAAKHMLNQSDYGKELLQSATMVKGQQSESGESGESGGESSSDPQGQDQETFETHLDSVPEIVVVTPSTEEDQSVNETGNQESGPSLSDFLGKGKGKGKGKGNRPVSPIGRRGTAGAGGGKYDRSPAWKSSFDERSAAGKLVNSRLSGQNKRMMSITSFTGNEENSNLIVNDSNQITIATIKEAEANELVNEARALQSDVERLDNELSVLKAQNNSPTEYPSAVFEQNVTRIQALQTAIAQKQYLARLKLDESCRLRKDVCKLKEESAEDLLRLAKTGKGNYEQLVHSLTALEDKEWDNEADLMSEQQKLLPEIIVAAHQYKSLQRSAVAILVDASRLMNDISLVKMEEVTLLQYYVDHMESIYEKERDDLDFDRDSPEMASRTAALTKLEDNIAQTRFMLVTKRTTSANHASHAAKLLEQSVHVMKQIEVVSIEQRQILVDLEDQETKQARVAAENEKNKEQNMLIAPVLSTDPSVDDEQQEGDETSVSTPTTLSATSSSSSSATTAGAPNTPETTGGNSDVVLRSNMFQVSLSTTSGSSGPITPQSPGASAEIGRGSSSIGSTSTPTNSEPKINWSLVQQFRGISQATKQVALQELDSSLYVLRQSIYRKYREMISLHLRVSQDMEAASRVWQEEEEKLSNQIIMISTEAQTENTSYGWSKLQAARRTSVSQVLALASSALHRDLKVEESIQLLHRLYAHHNTSFESSVQTISMAGDAMFASARSQRHMHDYYEKIEHHILQGKSKQEKESATGKTEADQSNKDVHGVTDYEGAIHTSMARQMANEMLEEASEQLQKAVSLRGKELEFMQNQKDFHQYFETQLSIIDPRHYHAKSGKGSKGSGSGRGSGRGSIDEETPQYPDTKTLEAESMVLDQAQQNLYQDQVRELYHGIVEVLEESASLFQDWLAACDQAINEHNQSIEEIRNKSMHIQDRSSGVDVESTVVDLKYLHQCFQNLIKSRSKVEEESNKNLFELSEQLEAASQFKQKEALLLREKLLTDLDELDAKNNFLKQPVGSVDLEYEMKLKREVNALKNRISDETQEFESLQSDSVNMLRQSLDVLLAGCDKENKMADMIYEGCKDILDNRVFDPSAESAIEDLHKGFAREQISQRFDDAIGELERAIQKKKMAGDHLASAAETCSSWGVLESKGNTQFAKLRKTMSLKIAEYEKESRVLRKQADKWMQEVMELQGRRQKMLEERIRQSSQASTQPTSPSANLDGGASSSTSVTGTPVQKLAHENKVMESPGHAIAQRLENVKSRIELELVNQDLEKLRRQSEINRMEQRERNRRISTKLHIQMQELQEQLGEFGEEEEDGGNEAMDMLHRELELYQDEEEEKTQEAGKQGNEQDKDNDANEEDDGGEKENGEEENQESDKGKQNASIPMLLMATSSTSGGNEDVKAFAANTPYAQRQRRRSTFALGIPSNAAKNEGGGNRLGSRRGSRRGSVVPMTPSGDGASSFSKRLQLLSEMSSTEEEPSPARRLLSQFGEDGEELADTSGLIPTIMEVDSSDDGEGDEEEEEDVEEEGGSENDDDDDDDDVELPKPLSVEGEVEEEEEDGGEGDGKNKESGRKGSSGNPSMIDSTTSVNSDGEPGLMAQRQMLKDRMFVGVNGNVDEDSDGPDEANQLHMQACVLYDECKNMMNKANGLLLETSSLDEELEKGKGLFDEFNQADMFLANIHSLRDSLGKNIGRLRDMIHDKMKRAVSAQTEAIKIRSHQANIEINMQRAEELVEEAQDWNEEMIGWQTEEMTFSQRIQ